MILENWYCTSDYEIFSYVLPNETKKIGGIIHNHPLIKDGSHIKTNVIKYFKENKIVTADGLEWKLGKMSKEFKKFLKSNDWEYKKGDILFAS